MIRASMLTILSTKKMINGELHTDTERSRSMIFEKQ
jgi:hypothetical protein